MDQKYRKADTVSVYQTQQDKDNGNPITKIKLVPYSFNGLDSYAYSGKMHEGYLDPNGGADACIVLT